MPQDPSTTLKGVEEVGQARTPLDNSTRREVVLGGLAAATGVAALTGSADDAAAQVKRPARLYQVGFGRAPSLSDVQAALADILKRGGCPTCGLSGFDIRLGLANLSNVKDVQKLPGIEAPVQVRIRNL